MKSFPSQSQTGSLVLAGPFPRRPAPTIGLVLNFELVPEKPRYANSPYNTTGSASDRWHIGLHLFSELEWCDDAITHNVVSREIRCSS